MPASGATPWAKEDMKTDLFLIQHKEIQTAKSHNVKVAELEGLRRNAIDEGLRPLYMIDTPQRRWIMIEESLFDDMWENLPDVGWPRGGWK